MDRLTEIRSRREKATPGPWVQNPPRPYEVRPAYASFDGICIVQVSNVDNWPANAAFIASAPSDIDWLIARVEALEAGLNHITLMDAVNYVGFDPNAVAKKAAGIAQRTLSRKDGQ